VATAECGLREEDFGGSLRLVPWGDAAALKAAFENVLCG
jgi:hypothetical protein